MFRAEGMHALPSECRDIFAVSLEFLVSKTRIGDAFGGRAETRRADHLLHLIGLLDRFWLTQVDIGFLGGQIEAELSERMVERRAQNEHIFAETHLDICHCLSSFRAKHAFEDLLTEIVYHP